jgi:hypothetical protein
VLDLLGGLLADAGLLPAAGADALGLGRVQTHLAYGEVLVRGLLGGTHALGARRRGRLLAERRLLGVGLDRLRFLRAGRLEGEKELSRRELLRAPPEHAAREHLDAMAQLGVLGQQSFDLTAARRELGLPLPKHGLARRQGRATLLERQARRRELEKERVPRHRGGTLRNEGDVAKESLSIYAPAWIGNPSIRVRHLAVERSRPSSSA